MLPNNPPSPFIYVFLKTLIGKEGKVGWLEIVFKIISEIQVICILWYFPYQVMKNKMVDDLGVFGQKLAQYLVFDDIFRFDAKSDVNDMLWILSLMYTIFLVGLLSLIIFMCWYRKKISTVILKIWNSVGTIHYTFLFIFFYQYGLTLLKYSSQASFSLFNGNESIIFSAQEAVLITFILFFALLFCKFLYQPFKGEYFEAQRTKVPEMLILAFKIIDIPMSIFIDDMTIQKWVRICLMLIIMIANLAFYFINIPYYNHYKMKIFTRFSFLHLSLTLSNLIIVAIENKFPVKSFSYVYFSPIFAIFSIKVSDIVLEKKIKKSLSEIWEKLETENEFYWRLFALEYVLSKASDVTELKKKRKKKHYDHFFYGFISKHRNLCTKTTCQCQTLFNNSLKIDQEKHLDQSLNFDLTRELYERAIEQKPLAFEILIGFVLFLYQLKGYSDVSLVNLVYDYKSTQKNTEMKVITDIMFDNIEKTINVENTFRIDVKEAIDYYSYSHELKALIETNTAKFIEFWDIFKESNPSIQKLYLTGVKINKDADRISLLWKTIGEKYKAYIHQDYLLYGLYQRLIRSAPYSSQASFQAYFNVSLRQEETEASSKAFLDTNRIDRSKIILAFIRMKKEKLGTISFITPNIEDILHYKQKELLNQNINTIMPLFYKERHNKIIYNHIKKGSTDILNKNRLVFCQKKNGYISPFNINVCISPYCHEQILYCGILRQKKTFDDFILVLDDEIIDSFTEGIAKNLNISPTKNKKYQLKDISTELSDLHKKFFVLNKENNQKSKSLKSSNSNQTFSNSHSLSTYSNTRKKQDGSTVHDNVQHNYHQAQKKYLATLNSNFNYEEITKLYETFTSTGAIVLFNPIKTGKAAPQDRPKLFGYNTLILEETIQGSHIIIYQLQAINEVSEKEFELEKFDNSKSVQTEINLTTPKANETPSNPSLSEEAIPQDDTIKVDKDQEILFKNPFSPKDQTIIKIEKEETVKTNQDSTLKQRNSISANTLFPNRNISHSKTSYDEKTEKNGTNNRSATIVYSRSNSKQPESKARIIFNKIPVQKDSADKTEPSLEKLEEKSAEKIKNSELRSLFEIQKKSNFKADDKVDRSSVASSSKGIKFNSKIEKAIYSNKNNLTIKTLALIVIIFGLLCVGMLMYIRFVTQNDLEQVGNNISLLDLAYERLFYILETNRRSRRIKFIQDGFAPTLRHGIDYVSFNQQTLQTVAQNLTYYNSEMRRIIYKIDSSQYQTLYDMINITTKENISEFRLINSFDLCTEVANAALEIYVLLPTKPLSNNKEINFILNNTFNMLIVKSQEIVKVMNDDNIIIINGVRNNIIGLLIAVVVTGAVILFYIVKNEASFVKSRTHFIEILMTIKDYDIEQHLKLVYNFHSSLKENKGESHLIKKVLEENIKGNKTNNYHKKVNSLFNAKKANFEGTNFGIIINILSALFFFGIFGVVFGTILAIFDVSNDSIDAFKLKVINSKVNYFRFGFLLASIYEYITLNGTTYLMNQPINFQWEEIYNMVAASNFYSSMFYEDIDPGVEAILGRDLCLQIFPGTPTCYTESGGVVSKGLLGVNDYVLKYLRGVKDFFDNSNRTLEAKREALVQKDLLSVEILFEVYARRAYKQLDTSLKNLFLNELDTVLSHTWLIVVLSSILFAVATKFLGMKVITRMKNERINYECLIRVIPVSVILSNVLLKNYLWAHAKSILN